MDTYIYICYICVHYLYVLYCVTAFLLLYYGLEHRSRLLSCCCKTANLTTAALLLLLYYCFHTAVLLPGAPLSRARAHLECRYALQLLYYCFTALLLYCCFTALLLLEQRLAALVIWGCACRKKTTWSKKC